MSMGVSLGRDFVSLHTNTQICIRWFVFRAKISHLCNHLLCICFVQKLVLLVNTQINIAK
jgi:hypothetical protein